MPHSLLEALTRMAARAGYGSPTAILARHPKPERKQPWWVR